MIVVSAFRFRGCADGVLVRVKQQGAERLGRVGARGGRGELSKGHHLRKWESKGAAVQSGKEKKKSPAETDSKKGFRWGL